MKKKELLPIGSVVLLKGGNKRLMVCGRIQTKGGDDTVYDYSGCYFPEGMIDSDRMFFFNNENIERIYFIGLQDEEEIALTEKILELGEFVVKDGKIVPKNVPSAE